MTHLQIKISTFQLKIIAALAMTISHLGHVFIDVESHPWVAFAAMFIGRITFPIMAFGIVVGYLNTSNLKKYYLRLILCWIVSIAPYHLIFNEGQSINPFNNVIWTLLVGLASIDAFVNAKSLTMKYLAFFIGTLLTINSDWGIVGIVMIQSIFYNQFKRSLIESVIFLTILQGLHTFIINLGIFLASPLIQLAYTKEPKKFKRWLYVYYPLHLVVIYMIKRFV